MFQMRRAVCSTALTGLAAFAIILISAAQANAGLVVTAAGTALGFSLTQFATGFGVTGAGCCGPLGVAVVPGTGNVIVGANNTNYVFANVDGRNAGLSGGGANFISSTAFTAFPPAMAASNGAVWTSGGFSGPNAGHLIKLNNDGSINTVFALPASGANIQEGLWTNPVNGHLLGYGNGQIWEIDVSGVTPSFRLVVNTGSDGLTVSPDGSTVYSTGITGFSIATGAVVFAQFSPPCGSQDGMGIISSSNALNGSIIANCNNGDVDLINPVTRTATVIANGGTRGDFTAPDPSTGTLFLTQTNDIFRLSCGQGCGIGGGPTVPEPTTLLSLGGGLLAFGLLGVWRKTRSNG